MHKRPLIAPSILACDFGKLEEELASIQSADYIHFDVMDGHFVPNLSFGVPLLQAVKTYSSLPVDLHLMAANPEECVPWYLEAGADSITIHIEAATHINRIIQQIHSAGAKAAVAINPGTAPCVLDACIDDVDMVLVMSVNPGFGGQRFCPSALKALASVKKIACAHGVSPLIEVDGGIDSSNAGACVESGASVLVAGSSIFRASDHAAAIADLRKSAGALCASSS